MLNCLKNKTHSTPFLEYLLPIIQYFQHYNIFQLLKLISIITKKAHC
jgi:hypothetical protein